MFRRRITRVQLERTGDAMRPVTLHPAGRASRSFVRSHFGTSGIYLIGAWVGFDLWCVARHTTCKAHASAVRASANRAVGWTPLVQPGAEACAASNDAVAIRTKTADAAYSGVRHNAHSHPASWHDPSAGSKSERSFQIIAATSTFHGANELNQTTRRRLAAPSLPKDDKRPRCP